MGKAGALTFSGQSVVAAPLEMTTAGDGVVAEASGADQPGMLVADLDLQALQAHRVQANPDLHYECYQRYVPSAYQSFWQRRVNAERKLN